MTLKSSRIIFLSYYFKKILFFFLDSFNKRNYILRNWEWVITYFFNEFFFFKEKRIEWRKGYKRYFFCQPWLVVHLLYFLRMHISNFGAIAQVTFKVSFKKYIFSPTLAIFVYFLNKEIWWCTGIWVYYVNVQWQIDNQVNFSSP